ARAAPPAQGRVGVVRSRLRRLPALLLCLAVPTTTARGDDGPTAEAASGIGAAVREARDLLRSDRPAAAAERLARVIERAPDAGAAWATLGEAQRKRCQLALARTAFERALELDA